MNMLGSTTGCSLQDAKINVANRIKATGFDISKYKKVSADKCDLCGSFPSHWELYAHQDRYGLPVRSMKCRECGLIFITPKMTEDAYDTFYLEWYRKLVAAFSGHEPSAPSSEIESNIAMKFLGEHLPRELQIRRVLDVGGSTGIFCKKVCDVTGAVGYVVDPNEAEIAEARKKGLQGIRGQIHKCDVEGKFEVISMLRTIEHLYSIKDILFKIRSLLTPDGVFLLDIVNHDWLSAMFKDPTIATKIDHIYQLNPLTVRKYLGLVFNHKQYDIASSNESERYVYYLVKKKS